jgi:pimeloyl-ACP methyl ester carboxylesterase
MTSVAVSSSSRSRVWSAWAAEDRVFPLAHAERYATALGADLRTIADAYTYPAEDQPERTAELLDGLLRGS